jgi:hypothetical protein
MMRARCWGCDVDLTGGLNLRDDLPILDPAADLAAGENHAFWVFEDTGEYALLNCHVQAGSLTPGQPLPDWETRRVAFAIAAPNDRLFVDFAVGSGTTSDALVAGGWTLRCVEPFVRWTATYRGSPRVTSTAETRAGLIDLEGAREAVEVDLELSMALPPWVQGDFAEDLAGRETGLLFIGVPRYEQLYRAVGELRHAGTTHAVSATGLRTHRYGPRSIVAMRGHSWLTALFPSGRAFGSMRFPGDDGSDLFREAWVSSGSGLTRARVLDSPWLTSLDCVGETWTVTLDTPDGPTEITGETLACAYSMGLGADHAPGSFVLAHGMGRFTWDGETTCGLIERSAPIEELAT